MTIETPTIFQDVSHMYPLWKMGDFPGQSCDFSVGGGKVTTPLGPGARPCSLGVWDLQVQLGMDQNEAGGWWWWKRSCCRSFNKSTNDGRNSQEWTKPQKPPQAPRKNLKTIRRDFFFGMSLWVCVIVWGRDTSLLFFWQVREPHEPLLVFRFLSTEGWMIITWVSAKLVSPQPWDETQQLYQGVEWRSYNHLTSHSPDAGEYLPMAWKTVIAVRHKTYRVLQSSSGPFYGHPGFVVETNPLRFPALDR